jgi:hypothetical protein
MENNFILLISEPTEDSDYEILIAMNFGGFICDPIRFRDSCFVHHPELNSYYHGFLDKKSATDAKFKIERFLENYLVK